MGSTPSQIYTAIRDLGLNVPYGTDLAQIGGQLVEALDLDLNLEGLSAELVPSEYGDIPVSLETVVCLFTAFFIVWLIAFANEMAAANASWSQSWSQSLKPFLEQAQVIVTAIFEPKDPSCSLCNPEPSLNNFSGYGDIPVSFEAVVCLFTAFVIVWLIAFANEMAAANSSWGQSLKPFFEQAQVIVTGIFEPKDPSCSLCNPEPSLNNFSGYGDIPVSFEAVVCLFTAFVIVWLIAFANEMAAANASWGQSLKTSLEQAQVIVTGIFDPKDPSCSLCNPAPSLNNFFGLLPEMGLSVVLLAWWILLFILAIKKSLATEKIKIFPLSLELRLPSLYIPRFLFGLLVSLLPIERLGGLPPVEKLRGFVEKLRDFVEKLRGFVEKLRDFVEKLRGLPPVEKLKGLVGKLRGPYAPIWLRSDLLPGLSVIIVPLMFNGIKVAFLGTLCILGLKAVALCEFHFKVKSLDGDRLEGCSDPINDLKPLNGSLLNILGLNFIFPFNKAEAAAGPYLDAFVGEALKGINQLHLLYQGLWFDRKYKKTRKKIRRFFEKPSKTRRYWYLVCRWETRAELAWIGVPFRQYPQFKARNSFVGLLVRRGSKALGGLIHFLRLEPFALYLLSSMARAIKLIKLMWLNRPSAIQSFIGLFQPEAPVYTRGGQTITPPRRPRLVNLASDMEVFASQGSSLLVFMFLIWSFFARILLVLCLICLM